MNASLNRIILDVQDVGRLSTFIRMPFNSPSWRQSKASGPSFASEYANSPCTGLVSPIGSPMRPPGKWRQTPKW
jgi:hypothetical protein